MMVFRKGGRLSANMGITYRGKKLNIVDSFKYLGISFQTQGCVFTRHIKERPSAAIIAMNDIRCLSKLGMETAQRLFRLKITPIATYGLEIIWEYLTKRDFMELERIKAMFLKESHVSIKVYPIMTGLRTRKGALLYRGTQVSTAFAFDCKSSNTDAGTSREEKGNLD